MDNSKTQKFRAKLEEIRASLVGDVAKNLKTNKEEFSELIPDINDEATQAYSRQLMLNLGEQDREKLKQVEEALLSIKNGHYGTCQMCEKPIPEARLNIVPFAKYCVKCLNDIEQEKRLAGTPISLADSEPES